MHIYGILILQRNSKESYYEFNEDGDYLDPVAIIRCICDEGTTPYNSVITNSKGISYWSGETAHLGGSNLVGIISKFANVFIALDEVEPSETDEASAGDLFQRLLNQIWTVSGIMALIGFLLGSLVVLIAKSKKK
ncbi:hypothetical protein NEF87_001990 [Candidatus Lokiarchaeum ossiferum]|uniref:Uncharacterized protein n=1 Tax=Candidatus Lokiarchaeum ossiferum TaxID=2951803 RepID=A0ABY6HQA3_9ARCH|nr:hypothetical protein NEF87_001990 [Candidatus Lokiarchaeum sp. B-35]